MKPNSRIVKRLITLGRMTVLRQWRAAAEWRRQPAREAMPFTGLTPLESRLLLSTVGATEVTTLLTNASSIRASQAVTAAYADPTQAALHSETQFTYEMQEQHRGVRLSFDALADTFRFSDELTGVTLAEQTAGAAERIVVVGTDLDDVLVIDESAAQAAVTILFGGELGHDRLVGADLDYTWHIDGANAGQVGNARFNDVETLQGGLADDTFVLGVNGSLTGGIEGGDGAFDSLVILPRPNAQIRYVTASADAGTIELDGTLLSYAGLEPITDNADAADRVFTGRTPEGDAIELTDAVAAGSMTVDGPAMESVTFLNPTNSLTIDGAGGDDTITITSIDAAFAGELLINGGAGTDELDIAALSSATVLHRGDGTTMATDGTITLDAISNIETITGAGVTVSEQGIPTWATTVVAPIPPFAEPTGLGAQDDAFAGFVNRPFVVNVVDSDLIAVGYHSMYESDDSLATVTELQPRPGTETVGVIAYGGYDGATPHADVLYFTRGSTLYVRDAGAASERDIDARTVDGAGVIRGIVLDDSDWQTVYVIDDKNIYRSEDAGATWERVSTNLPVDTLHAIEFATTDDGDTVLLVGTDSGVYRAEVQANAEDFTWSLFGKEIGASAVTALTYVNNSGTPDELIATTQADGSFVVTLNDDAISGDEALVTDGVIDIQGSADVDDVLLRRAAGDASMLEVLVNGNLITSVPLAAVASINFDAGVGNDSLTIDASLGAIDVINGITYDGGGGTNTLTLDGDDIADIQTETVGPNTIVTIHDGSTGATQVVNYSQATLTNNLGAPTVQAIGGGLQLLSEWIDRAATLPDLPVLGESLSRALWGADGSAVNTMLANIFEDGSGFVLADLLNEADADAIRQALDDLDATAANVSVDTTTVPGTTLFDIAIVKTLTGQVDIDLSTDLFGGRVSLRGMLDLSVDVALNLRLGVDAAGFFVDTDQNTPEIVADNFVVAGSLDAGGQFGILKVDVSDAGFTIDSDVSVTIDLVDAGDNELRLDELSSAGSFVTTAVTRNAGSSEDVVFSAELSAAAILDGMAVPFDLLNTDVTFTWPDVTDLASFDIGATGGISDAILGFLDFDSQDMLDQLAELKLNLDAFNVDIPFVEQGLDTLMDINALFQDQVLDPLGVTPGSTTAKYTTIQEITIAIAEGTGLSFNDINLNVDTSSVSPTFMEMTYHVEFNRTLVNAAENLGFGFDVAEGLADVNFNAAATMNGDVHVAFDVGIDLGDIKAAVDASQTPDLLEAIFLRNGEASGTVTLTASNVDATARFGFMGVEVVDASGNASPTFTSTLIDPGTSAADGRTSIQELIDNLTDPAGLLDNAFTGTADFTMPLAIPFLGVDTPTADTTV